MTRFLVTLLGALGWARCVRCRRFVRQYVTATNYIGPMVAIRSGAHCEPCYERYVVPALRRLSGDELRRYWGARSWVSE